MIATLVTSPLGILISVLALLVLITVSTIAASRREVAQIRAAQRRARQVRSAPDRIARRVFHEADQAGRVDCPICGGDGGTLQLVSVPWGMLVELEAHGLPMPEGTVIPVLVRCPSCGAPADEDRHGPGLVEVGRGASSGPVLLQLAPKDDCA